VLTRPNDWLILSGEKDVQDTLQDLEPTLLRTSIHIQKLGKGLWSILPVQMKPQNPIK